MDKVIDMFSKQKKSQIKNEYEDIKALQVYLFEPALVEFRDSYLNTDLSAVKNILRECRMVEDIYEVFYGVISQKILPLVYSEFECAKSMGINMEPGKNYEVSCVLEIDQITPNMLEKFKGQDIIYAKVTEDQMYRFKRNFLAHNVQDTTKKLIEAKDVVEIMNLVYSLMTTGALPVLWPMISEYDDVVDLIVEPHLVRIRT